jgi:hypothetical protein
MAGPAGTVQGSVTGEAVSLTFAVDASDCSFPIGVTATLTDNRITGTYATVNCSFRLTGNITLTRAGGL